MRTGNISDSPKVNEGMQMIQSQRGATKRRDKSPITPLRPRDNFTPAVLEALAKDLQTGKIPLDKMVISDAKQPGLRAIVRPSGSITYFAHYVFGEHRPMLRLGEHPKMKISEARELTETIRQLAAKGLDVQVGLHDKLIRELSEQGTKWRP